MSDEDLRRLERAFREGGGVDAHARWIAARVRMGELGPHRARLAAAFGHDAAARALGVARGRPGRAAWLEVVEACAASRSPRAHAEARWILTGEGEPPSAREPELDEDQVQARIALAAAREAHAAAGIQAPADVAYGLERLAAWVECPCATHHRELVEASTPPSRFMGADEVLACFVAAEQPRIQQLLDELHQAPDDAQDDAEDDELDDDAAEPAGFDAWDAYRWTDRLGGGALFPTHQRLAYELTRTRRGAALLAGWGALTCLDRGGAERAVLVATFVTGEDEVRDAVVAAVGGWLLREEA